MRTRRSPRNQERLWRALGGPVAPPAPPLPANRCFDCASYPKGGRSRGHCVLRGVMVAGVSADRPCFLPRTQEPGAGQPLCDCPACPCAVPVEGNEICADCRFGRHCDWVTGERRVSGRHFGSERSARG